MKKDKIKKRCNELFELGMVFNSHYNSYIGEDKKIKDFNIHVNEISLDSDKEWNSKIKSLKLEKEKRFKNIIETS